MKTARTFRKLAGFTLVELMVVVSVIAILSAIVYANFGDSRKIARDDVRKTDLKNLQIAIELYKAQNGRYPEAGCSGSNQWSGPGPESTNYFFSCDEYILDLVPDYIEELPTDPSQENVDNKGYFYQTNANGTAYKMIANTVEKLYVTDYKNEMARCPSDQNKSYCDAAPTNNVYSVYSAGAIDW